MRSSLKSGYFYSVFAALDPFSEGHASVNLHYNMFDWDLGRAFFLSRHLGLRPFIGMKGGWIAQKIHSYWSRVIDSIPIYATENLKQNFEELLPQRQEILRSGDGRSRFSSATKSDSSRKPLP